MAIINTVSTSPAMCSTAPRRRRRYPQIDHEGGRYSMTMGRGIFQSVGVLFVRWPGFLFLFFSRGKLRFRFLWREPGDVFYCSESVRARADAIYKEKKACI
jgi:hypothetical protein